MAAATGDQRQRLIEVMIAMAACYGYGGASVTRVVREAGVSRPTFYEHFADKDECFIAAFREIAARVEPGLERGGELSLAENVAVLLESAARDPAAARFCLLEGLAGDERVRAEHRALMARAENSIERYLEGPPGGAPRLRIPPRGALGGLAGVVAIKAFAGEADRLGELRDDLVAWVESYAIPATSRCLTAAEWEALGEGLVGAGRDSLGPAVLERRLPRGRGALPPAVAASERRERIMAAVARQAREQGYTAMSVANIVATAGVTREAFYEQFRGKEDAFLATQVFALESSVGDTAGQFFNEASWPERVWNGLKAMLEYVAAQRDLVYVDLIECYAAGPAAIRRTTENRMAYTLFLEDGYRQRPEAAGLPRLFSEAIASGVHELLRRQVAMGRTERMLEVLPQAAYLTLAPFIGAEAALSLVEERCRKAA